MADTEKQLKYAPLKRLQLMLLCEWSDCYFKTSSMPIFIDHIETHFQCFLPEGVTAYNYTSRQLETDEEQKCCWNDCYYSTIFPASLIRHLYFHAFHTKVKSLGKSLLTMVKDIPECQIDRQHRNLLQELPTPFECHWRECEYFTDNIESFYVHMGQHFEDLEIGEEAQCLWEGCGLIFPNRHRLKEHLPTHTQEKRFGCPNCGNMFTNRTKYLDHLEKQVPIDDQNFQCSHCSKIFANHRLLRDHVRRHVNHYKCPLCDMTCNSPSNLRNHIRSRHSDDRPYECDFCGLGCRTKCDLQRHVQTHSQEEAFWCDYKACSYTAKTSTSLRRHYQKEHLKIDPKKYCCHICNLRFTQGGRLTRHLKNKHKFKWPSGFSRFRYKEHEDGLYRLQTVRYESLEITEQFLNEKKQTNSIQSNMRLSLRDEVNRVQEGLDMQLNSEVPLNEDLIERSIVEEAGMTITEETELQGEEDGIQVSLQDAEIATFQ